MAYVYPYLYFHHVRQFVYIISNYDTRKPNPFLGRFKYFGESFKTRGLHPFSSGSARLYVYVYSFKK
jgi:hypothetical protein